MITTVTLNAAIDKTYEMSSFGRYQVNRTDAEFAEPGGKGINVAKVLETLGARTTASGLVGGFNGKRVCSLLDQTNISHDFTYVAEESRLCLNIVEPSGKQTEILEAGPNITSSDWASFKEMFTDLAKKSDVMTLSGSLPKGLPKQAYAELVGLAKPYTRTILDTSGEALKEALEAQPFMIKPNEQEFTELLGRQVVGDTDWAEVLREWQPHDIPVVALTLGSQGAFTSIRGESYKVIQPEISVVNPVGSGDAFTAGMAFGLEKQWPIEKTLTLAAASGIANALEKRAGSIDTEQVARLQNQIQIEKL